MKIIFVVFNFIILVVSSFSSEKDLFKEDLIKRNKYFFDKVCKKLLAKNAKKQEPKMIVVACSDARVDPAKIFNMELGDIFTVELAGNVVTDEGLGSIEYAVSALGIEKIMILGHTKCGAVTAAVKGLKGSGLEKSKNMKELMENIKTVDCSKLDYKNLNEEEKTAKCIEESINENIFNSAKELIEGSKIIKESGVKIYKAIYNLEIGKVEFLD